MLEPKQSLKNINSTRVEQHAQPWLMKLDANESYMGPSPKVMKCLENLQIKDVSLYPSYEKIYEKIAELNNITPENIALTNGSGEAVSALINTYINPSDTIITVTPSFSLTCSTANIAEARYIKVPYNEKWIFPENTFISAIDDSTKIILLASPNNPTGDIINQDFIERIVELYPEKLIIIDETYAHFADISCFRYINKYNNIAVVRSFSSDYGLAGLRIGYITADSEIISNVKKIINPYSVSNIAALAAYEAISDKRYIEFIKKETLASKQIMSQGLKKLGAEVYDSHANFVLADFKDKAEEIFNTLKEHKILVKNFFDTENLKNCLRITVPSVTATREILQILTPKDTIVFDMDGVLVDVSNSHKNAVRQTYEKFTGQTISPTEIQNAQNQGGFNNARDLTHYLISLTGAYIPYDEVINEFQKIYWNDGAGLINNEELLIDKNLLEELSKQYTLAIFTSRLKNETEYTLNKFNLKKYFSSIITTDDLPNNKQKPDTLGLDIIKKELSPLNMYYLGDTTDDIVCAKNYNINAVGVLPPSDKSDGLKDLFFVSGAEYVINNVNDIKTIIAGENENRQRKSPY